MGGVSIWHWLIVLIMVGVPAALIALVIWLVVRSNRRSSTATVFSNPSAATTPSPASAEERLLELDALRSKGLIDDQEYESRRSAILSDL